VLFNSNLFLLFALIVFPAVWLARHRAQNLILLVASYAFYGAWDARFLLLLAGSTIVDYLVALRMPTATPRSWCCSTCRSARRSSCAGGPRSDVPTPHGSRPCWRSAASRPSPCR